MLLTYRQKLISEFPLVEGASTIDVAFYNAVISNQVDQMIVKFGPDPVLAVDQVKSDSGKWIGTPTYGGHTTSIDDWEQLENINPEMFTTYVDNNGEKRALIVG